jgi:hypothetical protein
MIFHNALLELCLQIMIGFFHTFLYSDTYILYDFCIVHVY